MAYEDLYAQEMERRKVSRAMLNRPMGGTQMVSGRAVPYSPIQGMAHLGEAWLENYQQKKANQRLAQVKQREKIAREEATQRVMDAIMGQEAIPGTPAGPETPAVTEPLLGPPEFEEGFQEITPAIPGDPAIPGTPAVEPDLMRASMIAATDPALSKNKALQNVIQARMKAERPYIGRQRPTLTSSGYITPDPTDPTGYRPLLDPEGQQYLGPYADPDLQRRVAAGRAGGKITGGTQAQAEVDLPGVEARATETERLIDELADHPGMKDVVGFPDNPFVLKGLMPGTDAADFRNRLRQLTSRTFMEIFPTLKGGGPITDVEGQKGQESINRMDTATSEKEFMSAYTDFKAEIKRLKDQVRIKAGFPPEISPETSSKEDRYQAYKRRMQR